MLMFFPKRLKQLICPFYKCILIVFLVVLCFIIIQNLIIKINLNDFYILNVRNLTCNKNLISKIFVTNSSLIHEKKTLETRIECVGSLSNQSCLFQNLYYFNGEFIILIVKGTKLVDYSVRTNAFIFWPKAIRRREFNSYSNLEEFVRIIVDPKIFSSVTLYFIQDWHYNIGHALFDGLYPAYLALIRFPPRHLQAFRILTELRDCQGCSSEDIFNRFSGLGILKESILSEMSQKRWFLFDEIIMGSGAICQRCTQPNLQLPGGVEMDGSRLFRDRMYQQLGLIPPIIRQKSSSEGRTSNDILHVFVIHNKRFTIDDQQEIADAIIELNNYTETIDKSKKLEWPLVRVSYLHYNGVKGQNFNISQNNTTSTMNEFIENNFIGQLRLLRQMDIHLSGPGNGQMYQTFLSDGSIHINLGGLRPEGLDNPEKTFTSYGEQYMTSGTPYIKGLYYPINLRPLGIKKDLIIKLIRQAAQLILQGFSLPVNSQENLAPDGRLFVEMCVRDKEFCSRQTTRSASIHFACLNFWIEELIHEYRHWKVGGFINNNNKNITCSYNHTLLQQLRQKYQIEWKDVND